MRSGNVSLHICLWLMLLAQTQKHLYAMPPDQFASESQFRGTPHASEQFKTTPHYGLRFLIDLGPGYVMAQRIADKAQVILQTDPVTPRIFEINKETATQNRHPLHGWRRWWISQKPGKLDDPRNFLLIEVFENEKRGIKNANGKIILKPEFSEIDIDHNLHIVAKRTNDMQTSADLLFFDITGNLRSTKSNISPYPSTFIQDGFVQISARHTGVEEEKIGLMNSGGAMIYPISLESCMISCGMAHCRQRNKNGRVYLLIDIHGKILCESTDEELVSKTYKTLQDNWMATQKTARPAPLRSVDIDSIQYIAEADHTTDTEHFSPAWWKAQGNQMVYRKPMFSGFLQDHKILGLPKSELIKLLGSSSEQKEDGYVTIGYSLSGLTCGNAAEAFVFKLQDNRVCAWKLAKGSVKTSWQEYEPDLNSHNWRVGPLPDNE